ncbi:hypothetical protein GH714_019854 [Hevea brasiliensis]|uniref:CRAL/TRIO N-terminal domain-containing protein n=1 Tax=Hevea brasiliensis TaxID=3981 RepID=A0A6A6K5W2_HEVBR|nr:hypothetical protein GH714_019854 [Hevea brasiliensis]
MGKKEQQQLRDHKGNERVEAVLELLRKQSPLTVKQEKFCNNACIERFLKAKGDNVKKAAKHLRACLSWRESIGTDFSHEARLPQIPFAETGVRPFVELSTVIIVVSSLDFEESLEFSDFSSYPRASSLRFDPSPIISTSKIGSCSSSRFSFTVSHHFDSLKPWYLTLTDTSASKVEPTCPYPLGPALISPLNARSLSFASPAARTPLSSISGGSYGRPAKKNLFPSTPLPQRVTTSEPIKISHPRTPRPSFLQSPAMFFKKECYVNRTDKSRQSFLPYLKFYRRPYDEMIYRSKMRPPLGGLISIVSPHLKRRHMSVSQRF